MSAKRMRVFAGPNGSGKTTIFKELLGDNKINLGAYINADDIERELNTNAGKLLFQQFNINISEAELKDFFKASLFSPIKRNEPELWKKLTVTGNILQADTEIDSYLAADIAEFLRQKLLIYGLSFTYETVMSHESKIAFFTKAKEQGYRVYLYYIATNDPEINNYRVNERVAQKGHAVNKDVITKRYYKSLQLLKPAVKNSDRAYIFDNSGRRANLIAEITDGSDVALNEAVDVPNWVAEHLIG